MSMAFGRDARSAPSACGCLKPVERRADRPPGYGLNWKIASWTDPSVRVSVSFWQPVHVFCVFHV
jgi:hypothetical protein